MTEPSPMGISGRIARFFLASQLTPLIAHRAGDARASFAVIVTPREEEPQIDVTMANVFIPFPGASAKDVETLVAIPAEQVLVADPRPRARVVGVAAGPGADHGPVQGRRAAHRGASSGCTTRSCRTATGCRPSSTSASRSSGRRASTTFPIVALTLWTRDPARGAYDLEQVAHAVEVELKRVPGTREVTTIGGPGRGRAGAARSGRSCNAHGLAAADLKRALLAANTALPAGTIVRGNETIYVETGEFLQTREGGARARRRRPRRAAGVSRRRRAGRRRPAAARALRVARHRQGAAAGDGADVGAHVARGHDPGDEEGRRERGRSSRSGSSSAWPSSRNTVIPAGVEATRHARLRRAPRTTRRSSSSRSCCSRRSRSSRWCSSRSAGARR